MPMVSVVALMRARLVLAAVLSTASIASAGCGTAGGADRSDRSGRLLVGFTWTGGIAGRHEVLAIDRSGRGRLRAGPPTEAVTYRLALRPDRLRALREAVAAARIPSRHGHLAPSPPVPDGFVYRIAAPGGVVTFGDGGPPVPPALGRLASRLRGIVEDTEHGPRRRADGLGWPRRVDAGRPSGCRWCG
jgi:hypothetical protein